MRGDLRVVILVVISVRRKLRIGSHLLKKSFMENFIFCAVKGTLLETTEFIRNYRNDSIA